jgi:hypothetical protein
MMDDRITEDLKRTLIHEIEFLQEKIEKLEQLLIFLHEEQKREKERWEKFKKGLEELK